MLVTAGAKQAACFLLLLVLDCKLVAAVQEEKIGEEGEGLCRQVVVCYCLLVDFCWMQIL